MKAETSATNNDNKMEPHFHYVSQRSKTRYACQDHGHQLMQAKPSVRSRGTLAMIMINLAKSWLTMVPLSRSWLIMIYGTLVKIMARSWQDNHGKTCELYKCLSYSFHKNFLSSRISE